MNIYTNSLHEFCIQNYNTISDTLNLPHIDPPTLEEFSKCIVEVYEATKHDDKAKRMMSIAVKAGFDAGRPPNITFAGKKHNEKTLQKMRDKRFGKTPSKGKTWKRTPESVAAAIETRRLNKLKKTLSDI